MSAIQKEACLFFIAEPHPSPSVSESADCFLSRKRLASSDRTPSLSDSARWLHSHCKQVAASLQRRCSVTANRFAATVQRACTDSNAGGTSLQRQHQGGVSLQFEAAIFIGRRPHHAFGIVAETILLQRDAVSACV